MTVLRILFAAAFVYAVCSAAGRLLLRALRLRLYEREVAFLSFTAGAALVSTAVFGLATLHLIYTWALGGMGLSILLLWYFRARRPLLRTEPRESDLSFNWQALFWAPYLVYAGLYLLTAMMPETSPDATTYHLGLVARYYEHRGFIFLPTEMFSGLSGGMEMLFLMAFAFGRHTAAALVHLLYLLTLPFGMMAFGRRMNVPRAGVIGALLFFIAPVVGSDGVLAYIDVASAGVVFSAFYFLEIWRTENTRAAVIPAGLLAGFGYACKFTAGVFAVYGFVYIAWICYSRRTRWGLALQLSSLFSLMVCVVAGPWIVKDVIQFHDPFYPLFNNWFPNPFQYPMVEAEWRAVLAHMNGITLAKIPWQATVGGRLDGIVGPVFLLTPLALLSLRFRLGRYLLLAVSVFLVPYLGNIDARYLIAPLPFVALALGLGLLQIPRIGRYVAFAVIVVHCVASWPSFIDRWFPRYQWHLTPGKIKAALRIIPERRYLEENWNDYKPGLMLEEFVPVGEKVFSPDMGQMAYQRREVLGSYESALGRRAWDSMNTPVEPVRASHWIREFSFPAVDARAIRVVTDSKNDNEFSVLEMRFFNGGAELPRAPSWRLSASDFPWGAQLAFDASPVSWWTSGRAIEPGMWIAADFGAPEKTDRVEIEQIVDQRWAKLRPEALVRGIWRDLEAHEVGTEVPPDPDLRMQVRDEFKTMGIRWILINDGSAAGRDLRDHSAYWGIAQVGAVNSYRLWRLD